MLKKTLLALSVVAIAVVAGFAIKSHIAVAPSKPAASPAIAVQPVVPAAGDQVAGAGGSPNYWSLTGCNASGTCTLAPLNSNWQLSSTTIASSVSGTYTPYSGATKSLNLGQYGITAGTSTTSNVDSFYFAAATSTGDYGTYLNTLCPSVASGTTIFLPQGNIGYGQTINITQRCTYQGVGGNGTILTWTGSQGGTMVNENWGTSIQGDGGGLKNLTLYGNNATTTNPTICLLQGGNAGARTANNDGLVIDNCGIGYNTASNTYMSILSNSTITGNGQDVLINTANNSGESMNWFNVKVVDPANASATNCFYVKDNGLENGYWSGGSQDDCGSYFGNGNNMTYVGINFENPGYPTYGRYTYISETSSFYGTTVTVIGGNMQNDATSSAQAPVQFISIGGDIRMYGVEFSKGSASAFQVPEVVNNNNSSVNGVATLCDNLNQNNSGSAVASMFPTSNTTNVDNEGCITLDQNDYVNGYDVSSQGTVWYQAGGIAETLYQSGFGDSIFTYYGRAGFATTTVSVSSCGAGSPSVLGSDDQGAITIGTGGITSCKLNFSPNWTTAPVCVVSDSSSTDSTEVTAVSSSSVTISFNLSLAAGTAYYICQGNPN